VECAADWPPLVEPLASIIQLGFLDV
jgi:hypothetical protein